MIIPCSCLKAVIVQISLLKMTKSLGWQMEMEEMVTEIRRRIRVRRRLRRTMIDVI